MKKILLVFVMFLPGFMARAQQNLLTYDDITFIIRNDIQKADDFMLSKGYEPVKTKLKPGNKSYTLTLADGNKAGVEFRYDGKRVYIYMTTDEPQQYNLLINSISPYIINKSVSGDVLSYRVKELGEIYIMVNDKMPYHPLKQDYDIRIVSDKNIIAYN